VTAIGGLPTPIAGVNAGATAPVPTKVSIEGPGGIPHVIIRDWSLSILLHQAGKPAALLSTIVIDFKVIGAAAGVAGSDIVFTYAASTKTARLQKE
jgi:hypothetical protein